MSFKLLFVGEDGLEDALTCLGQDCFVQELVGLITHMITRFVVPP